MADESLRTMDTNGVPEYRHWTATSLQERARELGLSYQGRTKEQLIRMLEESSQLEGLDADMGHPFSMDKLPEPPGQASKSQWVIWYEEEMAILGKDATTERKIAAMEKAQKRQQEWEAAKNRPATSGPAPAIRENPKVSRKDFKPYQENTDVEGFFQDFEDQCELLGVPDADWTRHVVGLLEGGAAEAYRMMDPGKRRHYVDIKRAVLDYYAVSPDAYRVQFRSAHRSSENSFKMFAHKLSVVCRRWLEGEDATSPERIIQAILKEQFFFKCPPEIRQWVRERKPGTLEEAAALADEALLIHPQWKKVGVETPQASSIPGPSSAPYRPPHRRMGPSGTPPFPPMPPHHAVPPSRAPRPIMDRRCFDCGRIGHYQASCPEKTRAHGPRVSRPVHYVDLYQDPEDLPPPPVEWSNPTTEEAPPGVFGLQPVLVSTSIAQGKHLQEIVIDGQKAVGFRDSGAFLTIVDPRVVRPGSIQPGPGIVIQLAGGTKRFIPLAVVVLDYGLGPKTCNVGVMGGLPADALLGNDIGDLQCHFVGAVTRSQRGLEATPEEEAPRSADEALPPVVSDLSLPCVTSGVTWDRDQFKRELASDPTLTSFWARVGIASQEAKDKIIQEQGLLYRVVEMDSGDGTQTVNRQLIVPQRFRAQLLHLAHDIPMAGHQGKTRTEKRLTQAFYWPGISQAVAHYCRTCDTCQRRGRPGDHPRAPLQPLPIIEEPFQRVAIDIVGPLARPSRTGKRYILTIVDYATRYPEAVALSSISAPKVAEAMVTVFTRVGFPAEILSDQGTQFMSDLVQTLWRTCGVRAIRTTPYHPQTNGLCERFNGTLKAMLRAFVDTEPDWEKYLPHLLFAYREVPQESTGFSPFELLYGRRVRGPLTLLKEYWEGQLPEAGVPVVPYVLELRQRMSQLAGFAADHLKAAQTRQKTWYDRRARTREFIENQQVLMIVPNPQNKLQSTWEGPFRIFKKLNDTNYIISLDDLGRRQKTVHVNMLKEYHDRNLPILAICPIPSGEEESAVLDLLEGTRQPTGVSQVSLGPQLHEDQREAMKSVIYQHGHIFSSLPGRTTLTTHHVETLDTRPIQQAPYRVPESVRNSIREELDEMLELGVIQPSRSPWASPVVLVPKKDGSIRFCIDYRRLNDHTISDAYPMPHIDDLLDRLAGARFVTTLDLSKGYWQIPLTTEGRERSAFVTPFGLYEFLNMPFGMKNAPATFQRMVDELLQNCRDFSCAYLDDVAIFSETWEDHLRHVGIVLNQIAGAGLTIRPDKCQMGQAEVQYLGHRVGGGKLRPEPAKIEALRDWPTPETKKNVLAFLGTANYYRKFVPHFSTLAKPLTDLTKKAMPKRVTWTPACQTAFEQLKDTLTRDPVLAAPNYKRRFIVQTDASTYGLGAVLSQVNEEGEEHPVAFLSRKLLDREVAYATVEKECLAIVWALKKLQPYLYGREFTILTDHNPLTWLNRVSGDNGRLLRWSLALQPYNFTIQYRRGSQHQNADGLSRQAEPY